MDKTAFYKLSYGLYLLTAKEGEKENGCIINTAIQCASEPKLISICVINKNLTCDMIKRTGRFNVSVLTEDTPFAFFQRFGMQSGRDTDKFAGDEEMPCMFNDIRYLPSAAAVSPAVWSLPPTLAAIRCLSPSRRTPFPSARKRP